MKQNWRIVTVTLAALIAAGCTTERNPRYCGDGICIDPAYPFCDVDGSFGDLRLQCVAVACTPDDFIACRGDDELRCNATGTNYDVARCELGCAPTGGCRLCEPSQTACTNGRVATCDAAGNVVTSEACALGCFEDQPRCRDIDPSNRLAEYLDHVADPPDLDLENGVIFTETGVVLQQEAAIQGIPTFMAPASGSVPIRVIVAHNIWLSNVKVFANTNERNGFPTFTGPALAVIATGTLTIDGRLAVSGGAGGVAVGGCVSPWVQPDIDFDQSIILGNGGGGHATSGARGGEITDLYVGGIGGIPSGTDSLVPLRGGCASGGAGSCANCLGASGGGAIQLSSRRSIEIRGTIDVRGSTPLELAGGGGGGGLLIEAPKVVLGPAAKLIATGGAGGSGVAGSHGVSPSADDGMPEKGVTCVPASIYCGTGGDGAAPGVSATAGSDAAYSTSISVVAAGGGGGGLGRIRINTPDRTYTKANTVVEGGVTSTGTLATR